MNVVINLSDQPGVPLHRQLFEAIAEGIQAGRFKVGEALPSSRQLSRMLGLARNTAIRAYQDLESQGYVSSMTGKGTVVIASHGRQKLEEEQPEGEPKRALESFHLSTFALNLGKHDALEVSSLDLSELNFGGPPVDLLPFTLWRELISRSIREERFRLDYHADPLGYLPLREALADYLSRSRAIKCDIDQIAVFAAQLSALELLTQLFLNKGDIVAVESPGFVGARRIFQAHGATVLPIEVDAEGMSVSELEKVQGCRLVYVTPSHHDTTGAVMSLARREQILDWAARQGALIVEDDYDCEYRYGKRSLPSIFSLDKSESVIYFGTLWKVLFPISTAGYLVGPWSLMRTISRAKALVEPSFPMLELYALTEFINKGHLERQIMRSREVYTRRRQTLIFALSRHFGKQVQINQESSGLQLGVRFQVDAGDEEIMRVGQEIGLPLATSDAHYVGDKPEGEFLMAFGHVDESLIDEQIARFAARVLSAPDEKR